VLAWFNLLGKLSVAFYLIYMFVNESLYNKRSIPKVHVVPWADVPSDFSHNESDYVYCNNQSYDFFFSANWVYTNNKCTWLEYGESYIKGESNFFFFPTYFWETTRARQLNCDPKDHIFDDLGLSYENCTIAWSGLNNTCDCKDKENYFVMGAEHSVFAFSMSYFVPDTQQSGRTGESDVKVEIRDPNGNRHKKVTRTDKYIKYTIEEWLIAAGIRLDELNPGAALENGTMPYYRVTGVTLIVDIQFYNMLVYHGIDEWRSKTVAVVQVRPEQGWSSMGSSITYHQYPSLKDKQHEYYYTDRYKYGVKFIFEQGGYIGFLDRVIIQNYFITSIVLFAVIPSVVSRIGMSLFGFSSKIYKEQLKRHPDGIIRDMQHYLDTFNFLFNSDHYETYVRERMDGTADWCCCRVLYHFYSHKKDVVSREEWDTFCGSRGITNEENKRMWFEINNNPYLATKSSFDSNTLWEAVRKNYDKVSQRLGTKDLTTLIQKKWKIWDAECNERNSRRNRENYKKEWKRMTALINPGEVPLAMILSPTQSTEPSKFSGGEELNSGQAEIEDKRY
jgi:hypothetical protein